MRSIWREWPDARTRDCYEIVEILIDLRSAARCMSLTGDYDLTDLQTMQLLEHSYYAFYNETTRG